MSLELDEEELQRLLDEGSASAQPMELANLRADLARQGADMTDSAGEDLPHGTKVNLPMDIAAPAPSRVPITPKAVDLTQESPDDLEMAYASAQDRKARATEAFERGSRQLVAGLTRTPVVASTMGPTDAVAKLMALRKQRGEDSTRNENLRLGAAKFNYEQRTEAQKAAEAKARDERDTAFDREKFAYQQKHDTESLAQQADNAAAMRAQSGAALAATNRDRASGDLSSLRKEFNALPDVKTFNETDASFEKIKSAATNDSPAGDIALVTGFMKMIDPGTGVKEGEFANAENAGGVPEKIWAQYNKLVSGERLAPAQRADFLRQAQNLHSVHKKRYDTQAERYRTLAKRQGASPDDVIEAPSNAKPAPAVSMRFPDGSVHDVAPEDMELAKRKGAVLNGR